MPRAKGVPPSTNPHQMRVRLRKKQGRLKEDVDLYMIHGYGKPIDEWDLEELAMGKPRNKAGNFSGRPPSWLNMSIQNEARRRLLKHAFGTLAAHADTAIQVIYNLMTSEEVDEFGKPIVDARTRLAAAQYVLDHIIGKPKAHVEIEGTEITRQALAAALVLDDGKDAHPVIDGQFQEVEEDDDDE